LSATSFAESNAKGKSTGFALLGTMRVKGVAVAAGADSAVLDRCCWNSGLLQLALIGGPEIQVRKAITLPDYRIESTCVERFERLGRNRVATWSDGWSDSNQEVGRVCAKLFPSRADDGPGNPLCCTTPPGMRGAYNPAPAIAEGERDTVCESKEEVQAWSIADDPVTAEKRRALRRAGLHPA
jgi:hypothetical protein